MSRNKTLRVIRDAFSKAHRRIEDLANVENSQSPCHHVPRYGLSWLIKNSISEHAITAYHARCCQSGFVEVV